MNDSRNANRPWSELREEFCRVVFSHRVAEVAERIPATARQVYNIVNGVSNRPTRAIRAGIERLLEEERHRP